VPPDEPAVTGAPLRFGERAHVAGGGRDRDGDGEPVGLGGPPGEPVMPAGPPPLREPAAEPDTSDRDRRDDEPATSEVGAVAPVERAPAAPPKAAPPDLANMRRRERKQVAKRRARKVKRIVRRFDAWSVLKVAFIFNLCAYIVSMVAGVVLWRVADGAGVIENIESFIEDLGAFETYRFEPDLIFEAYALGGAVLAVLATGLIALAAVLFNLISDLIGGIRLTVIEEPGALPARRRRSGGKPSEDSGTVSGP
jgi:hypothetical protein